MHEAANRGPRWWSRLTKKSSSGEGCLLKNGGFDLERNFFVAEQQQQQREEEGSGYRYCGFESAQEFLEFREQECDKRGPGWRPSFHEVLLPDRWLKMFFDLDFDGWSGDHRKEESLKAVWSIVESFIRVMRERYDTEIDVDQDVWLFSSHGKDKLSYHLIINNYCFRGMACCRWLYQQTMDGLSDDELKQYVDGQVYGKRHLFRMYGSYKVGSDRIMQLEAGPEGADEEDTWLASFVQWIWSPDCEKVEIRDLPEERPRGRPSGLSRRQKESRARPEQVEEKV